MADAESSSRPDAPFEAPPDASLIAPADEPNTPPEISVGKRVGFGLAWTLVANVIGKGAGIALTIVLGYLLSQEEMGVWSATLGVYSIMVALRDGGLGTLLVQRGEREYENLIGPVFWLSAGLHMFGALALAAIAPIYAAQQPDKVGLQGTMLLCALALLLLSPSAAAFARLRMQLRFARVAAIMLAASLARVAVVLGCAYAGLGPMSFGWGLVAVAIIESGAMVYSTREALWAHAPQVRRWPNLIYLTRWNIALAVASALAAAGDSLALAPLVDAKILGIYYFAVSLVMQVEQAISGSASQVLFPAFAQFKDDEKRLGDAMLRACQALVLIGAPMTLGLGALADPLIKFVWSNNRWDESILCLMALSVFFVFRIVFVSPAAVLLAQGRFKRVFASVFGAGLSLPIAAAFGAIVWGSPLAIAICAGAAFGPTCLLMSLWIGKHIGVSRRRMLKALLPAWFAALACGAAVWSLDRLVLQGVCGIGVGDSAGRVHQLIRLVTGGACFWLLYIVLIRFALTHALIDGLSITPQRIRGPIQKVLRLNSESA